MSSLRYCVVGAGVIGLGNALCLQEMLRDELNIALRDVRLDIVADRFSPDVTSSVAAGFWEPYVDLVSKESEETLLQYSIGTWNFMQSLWLAGDAEEAGVQFVPGYILTDPGAPLPAFTRTAMNSHQMTDKELELFPAYRAGFGFTSIICQQTRYLDYLTKRVQSNGARLIKRKLKSLNELAGEYDVVINCTGVGANQLLGDDHVVPILGQVVRVKAPWMKIFVADCTSSPDRPPGYIGNYILPNVDFCILGGSHDKGAWDLTPNPDVTQTIRNECGKLVPGVEKAEVISEKCGLRPGRMRLRIETERLRGSNGKHVMVIHNYGHGGCGVTTQMGTCQAATRLAKRAIREVEVKPKL